MVKDSGDNEDEVRILGKKKTFRGCVWFLPTHVKIIFVSAPKPEIK